jgi:hypothetical protein
MAIYKQCYDVIIFVKLLDGYPWPLINKDDVVMTNINLLFAI